MKILLLMGMALLTSQVTLAQDSVRDYLGCIQALKAAPKLDSNPEITISLPGERAQTRGVFVFDSASNRSYFVAIPEKSPGRKAFPANEKGGDYYDLYFRKLELSSSFKKRMVLLQTAFPQRKKGFARVEVVSSNKASAPIMGTESVQHSDYVSVEAHDYWPYEAESLLLSESMDLLKRLQVNLETGPIYGLRGSVRNREEADEKEKRLKKRQQEEKSRRASGYIAALSRCRNVSRLRSKVEEVIAKAEAAQPSERGSTNTHITAPAR